MKKLILTGLVAIAALVCAVGEEAKPKEKKPSEMTPEERLAWGQAKQAERYRKTGGEVVKPGSRKGSVAIISQQKKLPFAEIEKVVALLRKDNDITYVAVRGDVGTKPLDALKKCGATFAVVVVDEPDAPSMLVANDERWATLNVAKYGVGIPEGKLSYVPFNARCRKGILRAYAVLTGGARSQFPGNILAVTSIEGLDMVGEFVPGDVQMVIRQNFKDCGVTAETRATYIRACKEGWAPAPTNDVQKAIWDRMKAEKERGPVNGMKITPPNQQTKQSPKK